MITPKRIAIVGAGFSGTLTAAHLLRHAQSELTIYLIERTESQFARGVAYSTSAACHLLNVPAGNMSAYPDDPDHFLRWAKSQESSLIDPPWVTDVSAASFLPRRAYGAYLQQVLDDAEQAAATGVRLARLRGEAEEVRVGIDDVALHLAQGQILRADRVVFALGNFRPGNPGVANPSFYETSRYHGDPWSSAVLPDILGTRSCLLVGSGLTMVDWALALSATGYRGTIHALSRRGLWPLAHAPYSRVPLELPSTPRPPTVRAWLNHLRAFVRTSGCDWRAAVDALRPRSQDYWQSLSDSEQRRFLHHVRPYWDCHRHRIAPVIADRLQSLVSDGQLCRHVGRVQDFRTTPEGVDVVLRERGHHDSTVLRTEVVLNCSGSESDYRKLDSRLIKSLLQQGLAAPDPLRLGLNVDARGALLGRDGTASPFLFTLGPPQKGVLWETTAVPEIRGQAARLAASLLYSDGLILNQ